MIAVFTDLFLILLHEKCLYFFGYFVGVVVVQCYTKGGVVLASDVEGCRDGNAKELHVGVGMAGCSNTN